MNRAFMQMLEFARRGEDPRRLLQQMAPQYPMAAQASRMMSGKSPAELQQMAINMCRERGTTPEAVLQQLGLR